MSEPSIHYLTKQYKEHFDPGVSINGKTFRWRYDTRCGLSLFVDRASTDWTKVTCGRCRAHRDQSKGDES